jgi:hypothetical protein
MTTPTTNTTSTTSTATTVSPATDFEFFEGSLSVSAARPQITIRKGGVIVISRAVAVMLGDKLSHVQLAYNPKTGAIGLRATGADTPGAYQLRPQSKGPGRMIGGKRFFKHQGLDADQARTYEATDFGNGIVGFVLAPAADPAPAPAAAPAPAPAEVAPAPVKADKPRKAA